MQEVTLVEVLDAREKRVNLQQELLKEFQCPLLCFTMNIAGPVKTSALIQRGFQAGLTALEETIKPSAIRHRQFIDAVTGYEAFFAVDMDADALKQITAGIEDLSPLGRLFDMDVIDTDGTKLSRKVERGCIVCGAPGRGCAAGRLHSVKELQTATDSILKHHFLVADRNRVAELAVQSLIDEVNTTPKPGLVDRRNNGSHTDMNRCMFLKSANALTPYFIEAHSIGQATKQATPEETFALLKQAGVQAERTMYRVTNGVNTHKGIIYSMGILCGALGRLWTPETPIPDLTHLLDESATMVRSAVKSEFQSMIGSTAGEKLYLSHGLTGIRGEVASGFQSVKSISLPIYQDGLKKGLSQNDAGRLALLHLITSVKDTNLYHRGGTVGAEFAANSVRSLLETTPSPTEEQIAKLDDCLIAKNLSPGGCADLLAITYFLHSLAQEDFHLHKI